jgi:hypothetical protein
VCGDKQARIHMYTYNQSAILICKAIIYINARFLVTANSTASDLQNRSTHSDHIMEDVTAGCESTVGENAMDANTEEKGKRLEFEIHMALGDS